MEAESELKIEPEEMSDSLNRRHELQSRSENLSEEEKAELMGLYAFPDNSHAAELQKKDTLGLINSKEKEELQRFYQLKIRQENNSPIIQTLWERTEANDPNVEQVGMDDGQSVEVSPNDEVKKVIWTVGLGGCYSAAVFTEHTDGTRNCVLTHYSEMNLSTNMTKLDQLINSSEKMKTAQFKKAIFLIPGRMVQDPETKKNTMKAEDQKAIKALSYEIWANLGTDIEIKIEPYSEILESREKDQGTFFVDIPPAGKGDARYQTWFSNGKLTD